MTNLLTTKGYDQFVIPINLKMKFTFFAFAQNISNKKKYKVIPLIFSSYFTRTW